MAGLGFLKEPENSMRASARAQTSFGLGRKLRVPFWWVQSFALNLLPQSPIGMHSSILLPPLSSRIVLMVIDMWHAALEQADRAPDAKRLVLPLPLSVSDEQRAELARYWSTPLRFKDETSLNFVSSSRVVDSENGGRMLELSLTLTLNELCSGRFVRSHAQIESIVAQNFPQVIRINPNVLRAMGTAPTAARVAAYFEFEILKSVQQKYDATIMVEMDCEVLTKRHKAFMRDGKLFYELGCTSWQPRIPRTSISQMKRTTAKNAVQIVWSLPPESVAMEDTVAVSAVVPVSTHVANHDHVPRDLDFLIQVAEFYESLNNQQRQALERQREVLSDDQFKAFVTPLMASYSRANAGGGNSHLHQ